MKKRAEKIKRLYPVQILCIGFAVLIFIGAILLSLPISSAKGTETSLVDAFFTSTSAVCVTGLVTLDTGTYWSYFGKTVIIVLIQIGGLGFMAFATLLSLILGKKITLRERLVMRESMVTFRLQGIVRLARYILIFTFTAEFIGAALLATQFIPRLGFLKGLYYSIWHSISAFCNAGFDIIGYGKSVTGYNQNLVILVTLSILIVVGGLGFIVWWELFQYRDIKRISTHSKVVLFVTAVLIFLGALLILVFEYNNPETLKNLPFVHKISNSFFSAITPRTAGFNSISTSGMTTAGIILTMILMFIGGSPGSTAGGIKTTTIGVMIMTVVSVIKGKEDTEIFKRKIPKSTVYKSLAVNIIAFMMLSIVVIILSVTEIRAGFREILYEATSALGTVGLTLGITSELSSVSKVVLMITMYCGRVGLLTVVTALYARKNVSGVKYPEDKIVVG